MERNLTHDVSWPAIAPDRRLHDLRHAATTSWTAAGIDIATVSAWLGQSNSHVTLVTYVHYLNNASDTVAITRLNALITSK